MTDSVQVPVRCPRAARATLPDGTVTHTVLGTEGLPIDIAEDFLEHLRASGASPNTVAAYARGLAAWWTILAERGHDWRDAPAQAISDLLGYLRTGDLPSVTRVGPAPTWLAAASVQQRVAAVAAFYLWADAALDGVPAASRWRRRAGRGTGRYAPMMTGVGPVRARPGPTVRVRSTRSDRVPVLTPAQVQAIVDEAGRASGQHRLRAARDRLLFALLPETGLRIGEALSLRHNDFHTGRGDTPWVEVVPRQDHPHGCRVKNGRGRRLYISDELEAAYAAYVWGLVDAGIDLDVPDLGTHFVFVNVAAAPLWSPMRPESVYDRVRSITARLDGQVPPGWSPHWMRHTHATALLLAGTPPHVVMRRLGHADIQTTLSTYAWVTEDQQMRALSGWRQFAQGWDETL